MDYFHSFRITYSWQGVGSISKCFCEGKSKCPCPHTSLSESLLVSAFLCPGRKDEHALEEWRGHGLLRHLPQCTAVKGRSLREQACVVSCPSFLLRSCVKLIKHGSLNVLICDTERFLPGLLWRLNSTTPGPAPLVSTSWLRGCPGHPQSCAVILGCKTHEFALCTALESRHPSCSPLRI